MSSENQVLKVSDPSITLYAFPKPKTRPSGSGFCQKLESYLRFSGLEYSQADANTFTAPKGKLPYIKDNKSGTTVADSHFIIQNLAKNGHAQVLDTLAGLDDLQKTEAHAWRCLWEDHVVSALIMPCPCMNLRMLYYATCPTSVPSAVYGHVPDECRFPSVPGNDLHSLADPQEQ